MDTDHNRHSHPFRADPISARSSTLAPRGAADLWGNRLNDWIGMGVALALISAAAWITLSF